MEPRLDELEATAREILACHGQPATDLEYLGAGGQSVCYGTSTLAVLIAQPGEQPGTNDYALQRWLTVRAGRRGVRTPRILAVGKEPRPYAVMQRAPGLKASSRRGAPAEIARWFHRMGGEVSKVNAIRTEGFGAFVRSEHGQYRGRYATWSDYLDAQVEEYLSPDPATLVRRDSRETLLAQRIITSTELENVAARVQAAKNWRVRPVLVHYDNRLDNLLVDGDQITLLDWGLAVAGCGVQQELIKLFEVAATSTEDPYVAAFLQGYGLAREAWDDAVEGGKLMLILDGLMMSYQWAAEPSRLGGIRGWLRTIKRICDEW